MAMRGHRMGLADAWVRPIHQLARHHGLLGGGDNNEQACLDHLCELNVIEQVKHLCESTLIEDAWERGQDLTVHGWIYSLKDGLIRNLNVSVSNHEAIDSIYANSIAQLKARYC